MADELIGTTPCPQVLSIRFNEGKREEIMCPNVGYVYHVDGGESYKSVCSGSLPVHEHWFGSYYLDKVTPL